MVTYVGAFGRDIDLSEAVVNGCLLLMASVIGSYVFGAVWDDRNVMTTAVKQTEAENPDIIVNPPPGYGDQS
jgi:hypothetical protein